MGSSMTDDHLIVQVLNSLINDYELQVLFLEVGETYMEQRKSGNNLRAKGGIKLET